MLAVPALAWTPVGLLCGAAVASSYAATLSGRLTSAAAARAAAAAAASGPQPKALMGAASRQPLEL